MLIVTIPNIERRPDPGGQQEKGAKAMNIPCLKPTLSLNGASRFLFLIRTV